MTIRYYYSDTIRDFCKREYQFILGEIAHSISQDINNLTTSSWEEEIELLQDILRPYADRGSIYFEYNIPRMGRRVDVVLLIDGIVFVVEFKTSEQTFSRDAIVQVWDYALDLKNFQEGSLNRLLVPVLVAPNEKDKNCKLNLEPYEDGVYTPLLVNRNTLAACIEKVLQTLPATPSTPETDTRWARSGYAPTPTIIEAATALYENHTVEEITKHDGEIDTTTNSIREIIDTCRKEGKKAICFVTGVPGAGKTLVGLQTAIDQTNHNEQAVYLSGNFPLVSVLQEALARDYVRRSKEQKARGEIERAATKAEAKSNVKEFIQMIHHYRDAYFEGMHVVGDEIVPQEGYFESHTDKAYVPVENVAIFDEAQRAWRNDQLRNFMKEKKHVANFPYSEPKYLLSCMDRHQDWGVVICLIGGGQEINKGEAGLAEWIDSLNESFPDWEIYMSDRLKDKEYAGGEAIERIAHQEKIHIVPELHLAVSMRSFRAEKVSLWVHQLLNLEKAAAAATLQEIQNYPIVLTRSLDTAKAWLKSKARGSEHYGMLASSKAERLKAISINVRYKPDFVHWYLEDEGDIRSSNALEDSLTEFEVQGLEIDWACVAWDADLLISKDHTHWEHHELKGGRKWNNINNPERQDYQINAYRVLLTRARQGMVIVVPEGNSEDATRNPEWYDRIYKYLKEIGVEEI